MTVKNSSKLILALSASLMLGLPAYGAGDVQAQVYQFFLKRAESGDANAQFIVAERLAQGKGVDANAAEASKWYAEAAKNGHQLAQQKLSGGEEKAAPKPAPVVEAAAAPARPAPVARPVAPPRPVAAAAVAAPVVAKARPVAEPAVKPKEVAAAEPAAKPAPAPAVDVAAILLSGRWQKAGRAAEPLPSETTNCLRTSEKEIMCFSDELTRSVAGSKLSYIVKATVNDLNTDGTFAVRYVYNVTEISSGGGDSGSAEDPNDILAKSGWQEPGHVMECRVSDAKNIACVRDKKYNVRFSR